MAIIEEGGVSKAGEKLFISQSSVSKYLKRLEDNIGIKIFKRESYPLRLTEAGELYFKYIKEIIEKEKELRAGISELKEGTRGIIKTGVTLWHSSIFFPMILPVFSKRYPNIRIEAHEGSSQEVAAMIDRDEIDFAIFQFSSQYCNLIFEHLVYERILFAVNEDNPLLQSIDIKPGQEVNTMSQTDFLRFSKEPFVLMKAGQNSRAIVQIFLNKMHLNPNIVLETLNVSTVINVVKAGMGVAFIPEAVLKIKEQTRGFLFFQVDEPLLRRELGIAYKSTKILSRQDKLFIGCLKELFHD
ncbi:MAG: LysR family transcriptional regulator [Spirochaetales bacterium]|nr:LysR family transcriptional regulator [Spirochaetales bacterium]